MWIIDLLIGGVWKYVAAGAIVIALFWAVRKSGADAEKRKHERAEQEAMTEGKRIDEAVAGNTPAENRTELGKWSRG